MEDEQTDETASRIEAAGGRRIGASDGRRIEAAGGFRSGNPRPFGRVLPVIPAAGFGPYADTRTELRFGTPPADVAPPTTRAALEAYINGAGVSIAPGFVGGVAPTIDGVAINAPTPPVLGLSEGDNFIHMRGTYTPSVYTIAAGFAAIGSGGTVSNVTFTRSATAAPSPAETYPIISGGSANDGTFDILWAVVNKTGDAITIETPSGGGNAQIVFMPPNLYVAFRNTNV